MAQDWPGSGQLRLALDLGQLGSGLPVVEAAQLAESLGYHSVWTAEAYGSDAIAPLAWAGAGTSRIGLGTAVMQMPARTPAMTAMTAASMDLLSAGRFHLGLGVSGPQVAEGWHGQAYGRPLERTHEYVSVVRAALRREGPLEHHGSHYDIPYGGADATGLGKPLKLIVRPERSSVPIYLAAIGPRNVRLAGEIADGWLVPWCSPARFEAVFGPSFEGCDVTSFDLAPFVRVVVGDDIDACRAEVKPALALYVGGMGARGANFYNDLAVRLGFGEAAARIQDLYLAGDRNGAIAAVPDALVDEVALCGPPGRVRDRLEVWRASPITTLVVTTDRRDTIELLAGLVA
ncbi:MAG TPA: LLM class F420-dependent oxidoreductase [Acidimicrobiales bacterium]|nr:LLM class F420-dependent oxidoreductase [Acidimicrobiales bacterium]